MPYENDMEFLKKICAGDEAAMEEVYRRYSEDAVKMVMKYNGTKDDAEDVFQDAVLAIFDAICPKQDFQLPCTFGKYFMGIIRNIWFSRFGRNNSNLKVRKWLEELYKDEQEKDLEQQYIEAEEKSRWQNLLDNTFLQLSTLCQKLLQLIKEGKSADEIVHQLGFPNKNAFYRRKNACINRWRNLIFPKK